MTHHSSRMTHHSQLLWRKEVQPPHVTLRHQASLPENPRDDGGVDTLALPHPRPGLPLAVERIVHDYHLADVAWYGRRHGYGSSICVTEYFRQPTRKEHSREHSMRCRKKNKNASAYLHHMWVRPCSRAGNRHADRELPRPFPVESGWCAAA